MAGGGGAGQLVPIKLGSLRIPCMWIRAGPGPIQGAEPQEPPMRPENFPLPVATDTRDPRLLGVWREPSSQEALLSAPFSEAPN